MKPASRLLRRFGVLLPALLTLNQMTCTADNVIVEGVQDGITLGVSSLVQTLLLFVAL